MTSEEKESCVRVAHRVDVTLDREEVERCLCRWVYTSLVASKQAPVPNGDEMNVAVDVDVDGRLIGATVTYHPSPITITYEPQQTAAAEPAFGSLLAFLIGEAFHHIETLAPWPAYHYHYECKLCGGTDAGRTEPKPARESVKHRETCLLARHLPRLRGMISAERRDRA